MNPEEVVVYEFRCAKGCGQVLGTITFPAGTPEPAGIHERFECAVPCTPQMISNGGVK